MRQSGGILPLALHGEAARAAPSQNWVVNYLWSRVAEGMLQIERLCPVRRPWNIYGGILINFSASRARPRYIYRSSAVKSEGKIERRAGKEWKPRRRGRRVQRCYRLAVDERRKVKRPGALNQPLVFFFPGLSFIFSQYCCNRVIKLTLLFYSNTLWIES